MEILIGIIVVLALIGGAYNLVTLFFRDNVANRFQACPVCPRTINPGDPIAKTSDGRWAHLFCVK